MPEAVPGTRGDSQELITGASQTLGERFGNSISSQEEPIAKEWLKAIIDDLDLESLRFFPTDRLTEGVPKLVGLIAAQLCGSAAEPLTSTELGGIAECINKVRREGASLEVLMRDYHLLKRLMLEAAAGRLRRSDKSLLTMINRIDEGFISILVAAMESHVDVLSLELQQQADTDALTGLYNVRFFRRQLHRQLELYKRYRIPFSLLMLDLDNLKQLNGIMGHEAGDTALRNVATILILEKRETDVAVRYGGDEFFLLLPGTSTAEGERLAYRINRRAKELNLRTGGREMTGISIGIVSCPDNGMDVSTLRSRADRAMYLAKLLGGGTVARYRKFDSSMPQGAKQ